MAEKLIYTGDKATYTVNLGKISSIDGVTRTLTSTEEANISSNTELFFTRIDARFRISTQDKYYSDWYDLENFEYANTRTFSNVYVDANTLSNVEVQFRLLSVPNTWDEDTDYISVSNVSVSATDATSTEEVEIVTMDATVSAIGNDQGFEYEQNHHYEPYSLDQAEKLNDDLSFMTNELYGHPVDYVKVKSETEKGKDFVLREYNLYRVGEADVKCIKVIVPDNAFPDNTNSYNIWGVEFPETFEIHVNNTYFKKIFGNKVIPQERDFLYFPIINRMYEVSSTYLKRALNMKPNYWVLTLTKWENRQDIIYDDANVITEIEDKTNSLEDTFNTDVDNEAKDIKDEDQLVLNDNDLDTVRNYINKDLTFRDEEIENYFTLISNSQYDLKALYDKYKSQRKLAITYKNKFKVDKGEATTLTFLATLEKQKSNSINCTMVLHSGSTYKITPSIGSFHDGYVVGDYVSVWKKDGYNKVYIHTLEITSINNDRDELFCELYDSNATITPGDVSLVSPTVVRDFITTGSNEYNMETRVRSFTEDSLSDRMRVFMFEKNVINVEYFGNSYSYYLDESLSEDFYYGFMFVFNLRYEMLGIYVYEIIGDATSSNMPLVQSFSETNFPNITKTSSGVLNVLSTPIRLTNIRLFDGHLQSKNHSGFLSRNLVENASEMIIVDNAEINLALMDYDTGGLE